MQRRSFIVHIGWLHVVCVAVAATTPVQRDAHGNAHGHCTLAAQAAWNAVLACDTQRIRTTVGHSNVNTDIHGTTLLHKAAMLEAVDCIDMLCTMGADRNAQDANGRTPLLAYLINARNPSWRIVNHLIRSGCCVDSKDKQGNHALHVATQKGHKQIIQELLDQGATIYLKDGNGKVPFTYAIERESQEAMSTFLQYGFDVAWYFKGEEDKLSGASQQFLYDTKRPLAKLPPEQSDTGLTLLAGHEAAYGYCERTKAIMRGICNPMLRAQVAMHILAIQARYRNMQTPMSIQFLRTHNLQGFVPIPDKYASDTSQWLFIIRNRIADLDALYNELCTHCIDEQTILACIYRCIQNNKASSAVIREALHTHRTGIGAFRAHDGTSFLDAMCTAHREDNAHAIVAAVEDHRAKMHEAQHNTTSFDNNIKARMKHRNIYAHDPCVYIRHEAASQHQAQKAMYTNRSLCDIDIYVASTPAHALKKYT